MVYVSKHILNTHIFQFNVPPLIILEWAHDIDLLTSFKKLQDKAGVIFNYYSFLGLRMNTIPLKDQSQQCVSTPLN